MKYLLYFILGSVFGFLLFCLGFQTGYFGEPELIIQTNTIVQHKIKPAIKYTDTMNCQDFVNELNQYRTNAGWINIRENKIYAGLHERSWYVKYILQGSYRNTINFLFGHGLGIGYNRIFFQRHKIGVMAIYNEKLNLYGNYGYMF